MIDPTGDALWARIRYDYEQTSRPIPDICLEYGISSNTLRDRVRRWGWTRRRQPIPRFGPPAFVPALAPSFPLPAAQPLPPLSACGERPAAGAERGRTGEAALPNCEPAETPPHPMSSHRRVEDAAGLVDGSDIDLSPQAGRGEQADTADPALIVQRLQGAASRVLPAIEATIARLAAGSQHPREMEQAGRALSALTRTLRELNALLAQHVAPAPQPYDDVPQDMDAFREELARKIEAFMEARGDEVDAFEEARPAET